MGRLESYGTPGGAPERHRHAYLPIQFSQLLLNKRQIQKYGWHAAVHVRPDTKQLDCIKKTLNQFRWNIDMDFCCHVSFNREESLKCCCAAWRLPGRQEDPKAQKWAPAGELPRLCLYVLFITTLAAMLAWRKLINSLFCTLNSTSFPLIQNCLKRDEFNYKRSQLRSFFLFYFYTACCTKSQRWLDCTSPPPSVDSLERTKMR